MQHYWVWKRSWESSCKQDIENDEGRYLSMSNFGSGYLVSNID